MLSSDFLREVEREMQPMRMQKHVRAATPVDHIHARGALLFHVQESSDTAVECA